jgi:hypothetical protein
MRGLGSLQALLGRTGWSNPKRKRDDEEDEMTRMKRQAETAAEAGASSACAAPQRSKARFTAPKPPPGKLMAFHFKPACLGRSLPSRRL